MAQRWSARLNCEIFALLAEGLTIDGNVTIDIEDDEVAMMDVRERDRVM
jgi:hypothetical protein